MRVDAAFDPFDLPLGETIYRVRSAKELSHADIQRTTGVHRNTLIRIERGERPPSVAVLYRLSKALGMEMWELVRHAQKSSPIAKSEPIKPFHVREQERKNEARQIFNRAVRSGSLYKEPCEVCGSQNSEGHHEDYSKPLNVIWLCRTHHGERHRAINCARSAEKTAQKMVQ